MIRTRVEPKPLPKVKPEHMMGVFGDFDELIRFQIGICEASDDAFEKEKARFFRYLHDRVDAEQFGQMQEYQLADGKVRLDSDIVKYIDPTIWFESKLRSALQLGLDKRSPTDILDIGTGPAHFPVVAEFYGHKVLGTDLPYRATGKLERGHLYDALADIYKVRRMPMKVLPFEPLPPLEGRFGMVTAFLAAFNLDAERKPWSIDAWKFLLSDLRENVLTPDGEIFMSLADDKLTPEVWEYLSSRAAFFTDRSKYIHIVDLAQFD